MPIDFALLRLVLFQPIPVLVSLINAWESQLNKLLDPNQYEFPFYFDWDTAVNLLTSEPLAIIAVSVAVLNIALMVTFKVSDHLKEADREKRHQAKLHIEAYLVLDDETQSPALQVVITNTGREPIVVRDIGYQTRSVIKRTLSHLLPIAPSFLCKPLQRQGHNASRRQHKDLPDLQLPLAISGKGYAEFRIRGNALEQLLASGHRLAIRDSLGHWWVYRGASLLRRELSRHNRSMAIEQQRQQPSRV